MMKKQKSNIIKIRVEDIKKIKTFFPMLSVEDKKIILTLMFKYREKLGLDKEYIIELSKIKTIKDMSDDISYMILDAFKSHTDEELQTAFTNMKKEIPKSDIEEILKLRIIPENIKKYLRD